MGKRLTNIRLRLMRAAWNAFREEGYSASLDRIAAYAHVARQTVYNHFESKDQLFSEVLCHVAEQILLPLDAKGDVRSTLIAFGEGLRGKALSADGIAIYRTLTTQAVQYPELAELVFREASNCVANYLSREMDVGHLRHEDPQFAAETLVSMLIDFDRLRGLVHGETTPHTSTEKVVDCFLRAFQPENAIEEKTP